MFELFILLCQAVLVWSPPGNWYIIHLQLKGKDVGLSHKDSVECGESAVKEFSQF